MQQPVQSNSADATMIPAKVLKIETEWDDLSWNSQALTYRGPHFPAAMLPSQLMLAGARVPALPVQGDPVEHLLNVRDTSLRDGDVLVVTYPDSGGEHLMELLPWLLHQHTSSNVQLSHCASQPRLKPLEHMTRCEIESRASPRIFLTQLWTVHFPSDIIHKHVKIIHMVRNPKDVATSQFHRLRRQGVFTFQQFLDFYLSNQNVRNGETRMIEQLGSTLTVSTGHQIAFLRQMWEFQQHHENHPVLEVHYEDMVKKPIDLMQTLGTFLQVPVSGSLCDHILSSNNFLHSLGQIDQSDHSSDGEHKHIPGAIGDWKNTFNMTQNETFNFFLFQTLGQLNIKFYYD